MTNPLASHVRAELLAAARIARSALAGRDAPDAAQADVLAATLYTHWFTLSGQSLGPVPTAPGPPLVGRLRAAHVGTGRFEPGWHVVAVAGRGELIVERSREQLAVSPPDYANLARPALPSRIGDEVSVNTRRDSIDSENGWWMSDGRLGSSPATPMVRLYWNCPPRLAPALIAGVTGVLEDAAVPYSLKCPVDAALFGRCDAAVVYLAPDAFATCKDELRSTHTRLAAGLDAPTPPLTLRLGRGVAAAEDPGDGQSYGQSRCAAVAEGLVAAHRRGSFDDEALVEAMLDGLETHGISRRQPYLAKGSPTDRVTPW